MYPLDDVQFMTLTFQLVNQQMQKVINSKFKRSSEANK